MVIDFEGNVDEDTVFTYDEDTEVYASCAATLNDEFWCNKIWSIDNDYWRRINGRNPVSKNNNKNQRQQRCQRQL